MAADQRGILRIGPENPLAVTKDLAEQRLADRLQIHQVDVPPESGGKFGDECGLFIGRQGPLGRYREVQVASRCCLPEAIDPKRMACRICPRDDKTSRTVCS